MAEDTWASVALPILEQIGKVQDDPEFPGMLSREELADGIGQPQRFLESPGLSDLGARAVGKWPPNDLHEVLLRLIDQRIASAPDDEQRSRWQRIRDGFADIGKQSVAGLIVEATKIVTGLSA